MQIFGAIVLVVSAALSTRVNVRCEPVATYMGPGTEPEYILGCVNPCAQGCWNPPPTTLAPGVVVETCACVGGYPDPLEDCCRMWLMYIDGTLYNAVALGECGGACPVGPDCAMYWIDEVTRGAKCQDL